MAEEKIQPITFKAEIYITISPQAQKILASSKYSIEDFKKWAIENNTQVTMGGTHSTMFLENMYDKQVEKNGSTTG